MVIVILVNSNNKHYPQIFSEKCLYVLDKKSIIRQIN